MNLVIENWTDNLYHKLILYLETFQDLKYKEFHNRLIPDFPSDRLIGIRTPVLRKIGKMISKGNSESFLKIAGSYYYEEILLQGIVSGLIKVESFQQLSDLLDYYAPLVDNWATCDMFCSSFKEAKKYKEQLLFKIKEYINSDNCWYIRIALVLLLSYYLDDDYILKALKLTDSIKSEFYYVSMAQAWLVATAFAKNQNVTMEFFKNCSFDDITFNRTIQKAKESYRLSKELKAELSKMKRTLDKHNS